MDGPFCPVIEAANIKRPLTSLKSRLFPRGRANDTAGLPKAPIDENPIIRGHNLCFDKTFHLPYLEIQNKAVKLFRIIIKART